LKKIDKSRRIVLGITGASGSPYAAAFMECCPASLYVIPTKWGRQIFEEETGRAVDDSSFGAARIFDDEDLLSPLASGSNSFDALVILPCSISTLGKIASGIGDTLLTRCAAVALKERRPLVLCVREAPLSTIALKNALASSEAGAVVFPLSPQFYTKPLTLDDAVRHTAERILSVLGYAAPKGFLREELP
jgi:4-hydroxy-3-polyprenylbenzoate decarboxylase